MTRLQVCETGRIVVSRNVTGRIAPENEMHFVEFLQLPEDTLRGVLAESLSFLEVLLKTLDPYGRHQRFFWDVAVSGVGQRMWVAKLEKLEGGYPVRMGGAEVLVPAFPEPPVTARGQLRGNEDLIEDAVTRLRRQLR